MRYTALSTTSSTSFCGQHVQLRCFCIGLANCYVAGTEPHRRSAGGFRTAFPAQDCNVAARGGFGGPHPENPGGKIAAGREGGNQRAPRPRFDFPLSQGFTRGEAPVLLSRRDGTGGGENL